MTRRYTEDEIDIAMTLARSGVSFLVISEQMGVPHATIRGWASARGVKLTEIRKPKVEGKNLTPAPFAEGFRWFNTLWR